MKKNFDSVSSRSRRALRCIICCVLIITFCLSLSVGLGYSKFSVVTEGEGDTYQADVLKFKADSDKITYAMRKSTGSTVVKSKDGKVKVTIPANVSSKIGNRVIDERPAAYVLYTKKLPSAYYTSGPFDYLIEYDIRLFALFEDESKSGYVWSETQGIVLDISTDDVVTACADHVEDPVNDPITDRGEVSYIGADHCFRINCNKLFKEQNILIDYATSSPASPNEP